MKNLSLSNPDIIRALKQSLTQFGFNGFCFHLPLENNDLPDVDLPKLREYRPEVLKRERLVIASDQRAIKVREYYFRLFADKLDSGLTKKKRSGPNPWEGPNLKTSSGQQFQQFLQTNDVETVVNWLVPLPCPWTGMFNLFTTQKKEEIVRHCRQHEAELHRLLSLHAGYIVSEAINRLNPITNHGLFSKKALRVLELIAQGVSVEEISETENLSVRGVCYHIDRMKGVLKCHNRSHLIYRAAKLGLI
ncbi:response regulator transcription factor [Ferrimonas sp.]|uniref:response regulator transcription factor n=1 Tax=Ferrimonas sp. TaxID=2080861 RepID=UPI003A8F1224